MAGEFNVQKAAYGSSPTPGVVLVLVGVTTNPNRMAWPMPRMRRGQPHPIPRAARHLRGALTSLAGTTIKRDPQENHGCERRCSRRSRRHEIAAGGKGIP
jgi:hypothetical protein